MPQKFCKRTRSERISDTVVFRHKYITQPEITPEVQIVRAVNDLTAALRQRVNTRGKEDMQILRKMNNILNGDDARHNEKTVTFAEPIVTKVVKSIPEPRVQVTGPEPRVSVTPPESRVVQSAKSISITRKPVAKANGSGPTMRSKYATAVKEITRRT